MRDASPTCDEVKSNKKKKSKKKKKTNEATALASIQAAAEVAADTTTTATTEVVDTDTLYPYDDVVIPSLSPSYYNMDAEVAAELVLTATVLVSMEKNNNYYYKN